MKALPMYISLRRHWIFVKSQYGNIAFQHMSKGIAHIVIVAMQRWIVSLYCDRTREWIRSDSDERKARFWKATVYGTRVLVTNMWMCFLFPNSVFLLFAVVFVDNIECICFDVSILASRSFYKRGKSLLITCTWGASLCCTKFHSI